MKYNIILTDNRTITIEADGFRYDSKTLTLHVNKGSTYNIKDDTNVCVFNSKYVVGFYEKCDAVEVIEDE